MGDVVGIVGVGIMPAGGAGVKTGAVVPWGAGVDAAEVEIKRGGRDIVVSDIGVAGAVGAGTCVGSVFVGCGGVTECVSRTGSLILRMWGRISKYRPAIAIITNNISEI